MTTVHGISQHCTYDGGRTVEMNDHNVVTKWMWCGDNKKCSHLQWYLGIRDPILGMCSGDGEQLPPLIELAVTRQNTDIRSVLDTSECLQVTRQRHLHVINHKASNLRAARTRLGFLFFENDFSSWAHSGEPWFYGARMFSQVVIFPSSLIIW